MGSRLKSLLATFVMTIVSTVVMVLPASPANAASCGSLPWQFAEVYQDGLLYANAINLRNGPYTSCGIKRVGYWGQAFMVKCWAWGTAVTKNGITYSKWTFGRHVDYAMWAWVSNAYLAEHGERHALANCDSRPTVAQT